MLIRCLEEKQYKVMGRKIDPISYRLGVNKGWNSRWIPQGRRFGNWLKDDVNVREIVIARAKRAGIASVNIERTHDKYNVFIRVSRPGLVIGRGGEGITLLEKEVKEVLPPGTILSLTVEEVKRTEVSAQVLAQQVAWDLEKRMRHKRVIKKYLDIAVQNKEVEGAKIMVAGRLNGAEIARTEHIESGKLPLTTLRADIDYGKATAFTKYGTVGVKVWLYKGEIFADTKGKNEKRGSLIPTLVGDRGTKR